MATQIDDFSKKLDKVLKDAIKEIQRPSNMQKIGMSLRDDVVKRTRLGYGVEKNGANKYRFKPLSDSYVAQRRGKLGFWTNANGKAVPIDPSKSKSAKSYLAKNRIRLDSNTSPKKSNLTQTGAMLDFVGVLAGVGRFIIGFKTTKQARKASYVSKDRPFMNASKQEIKRVVKDISTRLSIIVKSKLNF